MDPIRKLRIDIDLSESTDIDFLKGLILLLTIKLKLFDSIIPMKIVNQNNALSLL